MERASEQNHQPLPAHLYLSAANEPASLQIQDELFAPAVDSSNPVSPLITLVTLAPTAVSDPPAVSSFAPCGLKSNPQADPQAVKPFEIMASCGIADQTPFFVKKSKVATSEINPCSGSKNAATHPLHTNSFEINS
jgi:hypothetical protein